MECEGREGGQKQENDQWIYPKDNGDLQDSQ